jgi:hypothetical protein
LPAGELILPGSPFGDEIGFSYGLFEGSLIKNGNVVEIAFIKSIFPGRGNFLKILEKIKEHGYEVKVLLPSFQMQKILRRQGFRRSRAVCKRLKTQYLYTDTIEYCSTWYIPKKRVVKDVKT